MSVCLKKKNISPCGKSIPAVPIGLLDINFSSLLHKKRSKMQVKILVDGKVWRFSCRIGVSGRSDYTNKAAFSNFSGVFKTGSVCISWISLGPV